MAKKKTFTTTLDADLLKEAKEMAEKRGVAVGALIERALDRYLDRLKSHEEIRRDRAFEKSWKKEEGK